jgi:16S rRNA U516 pseudouridylate synthase RsuA-like enzyme
MIEAVDSEVKHLHRIRIGKLTLEGIKVGRYTELSKQEFNSLVLGT